MNCRLSEIPPTLLREALGQFLYLLSIEGKLILKPSFGSSGHGITKYDPANITKPPHYIVPMDTPFHIQGGDSMAGDLVQWLGLPA